MSNSTNKAIDQVNNEPLYKVVSDARKQRVIPTNRDLYLYITFGVC